MRSAARERHRSIWRGRSRPNVEREPAGFPTAPRLPGEDDWGCRGVSRRRSAGGGSDGHAVVASLPAVPTVIAFAPTTDELVQKRGAAYARQSPPTHWRHAMHAVVVKVSISDVSGFREGAAGKQLFRASRAHPGSLPVIGLFEIHGDCGSSAPLAEPQTRRTRTLPRPVSGRIGGSRRAPESGTDVAPAWSRRSGGCQRPKWSKVAGLPGS